MTELGRTDAKRKQKPLPMHKVRRVYPRAGAMFKDLREVLIVVVLGSGRTTNEAWANAARGIKNDRT